MTNSDVETLLHLILRTEMFITEDKTGNITSFICGFEIARNGKCDFSGQISELLENEFNIQRKALGWPGQVAEFGDRYKLSWESAFKKIGLMVLSKSVHWKPKSELEKTIRLAIKSKIKQIENHWFGEWWVNKWIGIVAIEEKWFQQIWTGKEFELIARINYQIRRIEKNSEEKIVANNDLINLAHEFDKISLA